MTSRERVLAALRHQQPDRVPAALMWAELHGPDGSEIEDEQARELLGVDVRIIQAEPTVAGRAFRKYLDSLPQEIFVGRLQQLRRYHAWRYRPEQSRRDPAAPSPLADAATPADVERFRFPDFGGDRAYHRLRADIAGFHDRQLAVFASPPHLGGVLFEAAWRLRGFEGFFCDLAHGNEVSIWLLDRLTDLACHYAAMIAAADADVLYLGDDLAEPTHLLISPHMWQRIFASRYRRIVAAARAAKSDIHVCFHSDGNLTGLLDHLLAVGIDAVEPVQPDCMNPRRIKQRLGDRLTLVGCTGTARLLHHGSPAQVRAEVQRRKRELAAGGGLILAPAYDLLPSAPWANIHALFEELRQPI